VKTIDAYDDVIVSFMRRDMAGFYTDPPTLPSRLYALASTHSVLLFTNTKTPKHNDTKLCFSVNELPFQIMASFK